nr:unnamed protein product [Digitaria exilis]
MRRREAATFTKYWMGIDKKNGKRPREATALTCSDPESRWGQGEEGGGGQAAQEQVASNLADGWVVATIQSLNKASPSSLKISLRSGCRGYTGRQRSKSKG